MISEYSGKILLVGISNQDLKIIDTGEKLLRNFIGGKGLATKFFYDMTSPMVDPLGLGNNIVFMTGPLTGIAPFSSRHSTVAKSPLTGLWASSDTGGTGVKS